ncbi:MAG: HAMP domain-containing sensor histidine kinase [Candidatus Neomarinimicrobiota bacterium]
MNWYRHSGNIKAGLFIVGLSLVIALLVYSQRIVEELREDNRQIVRLYSEIIAKTATDQSDSNLDFVFEEIIKKVQFPIIYSNSELLPVFHRNLPDSLPTEKILLDFRRTMDRQNEPIPIYFTDPVTAKSILIGNIHYGDSRLITKLQWLPFLELGIVTIFILFGFIGFSIIRNSEKRHIWVGMARETAHQLSTPVSALLGWIEWLKNHPEKCAEIVPEMEIDLDRLQKVNNRFSRMGSETVFGKINLATQVNAVAEYLRRRLPSMGKNIRIINEINGDTEIVANDTLLSWALENVIKNAIDAIERDPGEIRVTQQQDAQSVSILISDNGKGIPRRDWKNIFRPGFSTKDRGWGLGLSLTKRIVEELHKGKIRVVQSEVGVGTRIIIELPLSR